MVSGKAHGEDDILVEWLKCWGEYLCRALWIVMSQVWIEEACPEEWGKGVVCLLYKDGDPRVPTNYRGITLLSVVSKVFAAVLNERLMVFLDQEGRLVEEQAGFRKGRSCLDHIFVLKEVLRDRRSRQRKTFSCFIDIKRAYDSEFRDGLWMALKEKKVEGKMWRVLQAYYRDVQSCVRTGGQKSNWFEIGMGLRQGCVLSPHPVRCFFGRAGHAWREKSTSSASELRWTGERS